MKFLNSIRTTMARIVPLKDDFAGAVATAASSLQQGHVVAVPTDTIYGVAGLAQNTNAVNSIYSIKGRDFAKPIAISVGNIDDVYKWSKVTIPRQLLQALLPGPVTVVMERSEELNPALNPSTHLIGIRIPDHNFMRSLALKCGEPLALTSANLSAAQSSLSIQEFEALWPRLDVIVDGGVLSDTSKSRLGSTVVDLSSPGKFRIIRMGSAHENTVNILREHKLEEVTSDSPS